MKIQRYIARDMRSALAQVREALGPDAVILSSGRVGSDVEVVAAMDFEVARAVDSAPPPARVHAAHQLDDAPRADLVNASTVADLRGAETRARRASSQISEQIAPAAPPVATNTAPVQVPHTAGASPEVLADEMKNMRRMLEA